MNYYVLLEHIFLDIDECSEGSFSCRARQTCENTVGSYVCVGVSGRDPNVGRPSCEAGYVYNQINLRCEGEKDPALN